MPHGVLIFDLDKHDITFANKMLSEIMEPEAKTSLSFEAIKKHLQRFVIYNKITENGQDTSESDDNEMKKHF